MPDLLWWKLRTGKEALLFRPDFRAVLSLWGNDVVTQHDHGDGSACLLVRGPVIRELRQALGPLEMVLASEDDLREAGIDL